MTLPQAAYIAGLPQSPITYSPYTNTGALKEDLSAGLARKDFVLFSMYREGQITKEQYEEAKAYDLTKDFLPQQIAEQTDREFLYYTVMNEATRIIAQQLAEKTTLICLIHRSVTLIIKRHSKRSKIKDIQSIRQSIKMSMLHCKMA